MRLSNLQVVLLSVTVLSVVLVSIGIWQHNTVMRRMIMPQPILWVGPAVMVLIITMLVLLVIYVAFPRTYNPHRENEVDAPLIRILTNDERRVVEYIINNGGEALQKDIARELRLSRLKTHRIISSLKKRGVVEVEPWGNTNRVKLVDEVLRR